MFSKQYIFWLLILFIFSCKKDKIEHDPEPKIEFVSISPRTVNEYDNITITLKYTDGDGDLGENNADVKNLFVTDNRIGITYEYRIRQLSPAGTSIAITGTLDVIIDNAVITDNSAEQTVTYTVYLTDRAGHRSNDIVTDGVLIKK